MELNPQQIQHFERDGYLFFPSLFRPDEIKVLVEEVPRLYAQRRPENVREKGSDAVRTNFAAHLYSYPSAKSCTCTSSRSTARWLSTATSGSGTRTTAPGGTTT